jgi:formylmethanofuran dehydrogenase subunit C
VKIVFNVPDGCEAWAFVNEDVDPQDGAGQVVPVTGMKSTPQFTARSGSAVVLTGQCFTDAGVEVDKFTLVVNGATGRLSRAKTEEFVKAAIDEKGKAPEEPKPTGDT